MSVSRFCLGMVAMLLVGCAAQSKVRAMRAMDEPLDVYQTVVVRAESNATDFREMAALEALTISRLRNDCRFGQVLSANREGTDGADLILDLQVLEARAASDNLLDNMGRAQVEVAVALTDAPTGELLGSAEIVGVSSSGAIAGGGMLSEAVDAAATRVSELMTASGCALPRRARVVEEAPEPDSEVEANALAMAETFAEKGKKKFHARNFAGALTDFNAAIDMVEAPPYVFNKCLTLEMLKDYAGAEATCRRLLELDISPRLREKTERKLESLAAAQR